ncbi:MAG: methyltransferase domain-containing protein [Paludibacter sp.]|nr:methyltransferase domain-containing protein [Paludibacter sp.]
MKETSSTPHKYSYIKRSLIRIYTRILRERVPNFRYITRLFQNKYGIEIGGPSRMFTYKGLIPIYKVIKSLDGCNYSAQTIWEKSKSGKSKDKYSCFKEGTQYISDATDLSQIPDEKYDFIISSNCLEHIANPFKALKEWLRVIKKDGLILLVLPNKDFCFDRNRPVTQFSHLLDDYENNTQEDDLTHLEEIVSLHDLEMDKQAGTLEQFKARSLKNIENRALHHHIFDLELLREIYDYFNLEVLRTDQKGQDYIILGKKND